ncbi:MAG TPA: hypothetical protein VFB27_05545 [Opitutaceae bacterium]|nr:hypothetical protein [Opitutaceae bacterium]
MTTPEEAQEIAKWMRSEYLKFERLVQSSAAWQIRQKFGERHFYKNKNHNWAINKPILDAFKKIRPKDVVWSRSDQTWRKRRQFDRSSGIMVD